MLSELPQEVQDELTALLPPTNKASHPRTERHQTANDHFDMLRHQHGSEARDTRQMHHQVDAVQVSTRDPLADENVQDLWTALQDALQQLAATDMERNADSDSSDVSNISKQQQLEGSSTTARLTAVQDVAVRWVAAHVQHDLESVHWLLRRLALYNSGAERIQQATASLMQAVQQQVKDMHGAILQTKSFLL